MICADGTTHVLCSGRSANIICSGNVATRLSMPSTRVVTGSTAGISFVPCPEDMLQPHPLEAGMFMHAEEVSDTEFPQAA
jgi:hypothetical protein